jgi:hypothetical protein
VSINLEREAAGIPETPEPIKEPRNVYEAIARVMVELPAIDKGGRADPSQGGYAYRGIEQITAHAQTLLGRFGVVAVPEIVGDPVIKDITVNSKPWTDTIMRVRYRFVHGPSSTELLAGGEAGFVAIGRDNSDKGANKCMTQAYKYALIQVLMIGDKADDADKGSPEADARQLEAWEHYGYESAAAYETAHQQIVSAAANLDEGLREELRAWLLTQEADGKPINRRWPLPADVAERFLDRAAALARQEAATIPEEPPNDADSTGLNAIEAAPEDLEVAHATVTRMPARDVSAGLAQRGLPAIGSPDERKRRLAEALAAEAVFSRNGASIDKPGNVTELRPTVEGS